MNPQPPPPLVVDLDGTLLRTDLFHESALRLIKQKPWTALLMPFWLLGGRAQLKRRIASQVRLDHRTLPFRDDLVEWLRGRKAEGRRLVLATAADQKLAEQTVAPWGLFDTVLGSDGKRNLEGRAKARALADAYGEFDYVGNSRVDLPVWQACREAIVVNAGASVEAAARRRARVIRVFPPPPGRWKELGRGLRLYQWVKNVLVFVPAVTSHTVFQRPILWKLAGAFVAFGMCASGVYVANDLLDLEEDRRHESKKNRPFASGRCSIPAGVFTAAVFLLAGLAVAVALGGGLALLLLFYICLASTYSLYLKRTLVLDVLTLAILHTVRIVAGDVVTGIPLSVWLAAFAFFLFLSLAFSKRAAELARLGQNGGGTVPGRDYSVGDLPVVTTAGIASGFLSALVMALYINSDNVRLLYRRPAWLWGVVPLVLYYIVRMWVICGRGQLDDDPLIYTAKSPSTYYVAAFVAIIVIGATGNWF